MIKRPALSWLLLPFAGILVGGAVVSSAVWHSNVPAVQEGATAGAPQTGSSIGTKASQIGVPLETGDSPIVNGREVPLSTVLVLLRECGCPQLPVAGPASPEHVSSAWANPDAISTLKFDNGVTIAFEPNAGETPDQYVASAQESFAQGDDPGQLTAVRNTYAVSLERNQGGPGLATLHWIEGSAFISAAGGGGQGLAELVDFVETLPYCEGCST